MVHRCTEYKIKYYEPNEEFSKKMWLENIKFRKSRRAMNLADHYWDFQTSNEACACEECMASCTKSERRLPFSGKAQNFVKSISPVDRVCRETNDIGTCTSQEAGVQTPNWTHFTPRPKMAVKKQQLSRKGSFSMESLKANGETQDKKEQPLKKKKPFQVGPPASGKLQCCHFRNMKSLIGIHGRPGPFFPYGWNDDKKNIGDMKTFNVLAPSREVHPPAILAMKRRKEPVKKCTLNKEDRKHKSASLNLIPRINHSSIWVSEYKEKFSKNLAKVER